MFTFLLLSKVNVFGPQQIFPRLVPGLGGLGYGLLCIPTMIAFYYTVIMAWAFYFMFQVNFHFLHRVSIMVHIQGMRSELPWTSCITEHLIEFSTNHCFTKKDNDDCAASVGFSFSKKIVAKLFLKNQDDGLTTFYNKTCTDKDTFCREFNFERVSEDLTSCCSGTNCTVPISDVRMYKKCPAPILDVIIV